MNLRSGWRRAWEEFEGGVGWGVMQIKYSYMKKHHLIKPPHCLKHMNKVAKTSWMGPWLGQTILKLSLCLWVDQHVPGRLRSS